VRVDPLDPAAGQPPQSAVPRRRDVAGIARLEGHQMLKRPPIEPMHTVIRDYPNPLHPHDQPPRRPDQRPAMLAGAKPVAPVDGEHLPV
jgi:hypothetical protein